jgi:transcriptional regulator of arginine metabolism
MRIAEQLTQLLAQGVSGNQSQLVDMLRKRGIQTTQSSVSRALKKINAVKGIDEKGRSIYSLFDAESKKSYSDKGLFGNLVHQVLDNGQMIVVHTRPGTAPTVAKVIDDHGFDHVMGTVAGDDTILVVPKDIRQTRLLVQQISTYLAGVGLF